MKFSLIWVLGGYLAIELLMHVFYSCLRSRFQWLITGKDKFPEISEDLLDKFFQDGFDSELGWSRKPNTSKYEKGKYGVTQYSINQYGQRANPHHEHLQVNIATFGDSFTFGRQVNDNETFQWHLSEKLQSNVLNYGVGNYGLDQALLRAKREVPTQPCQIVILGAVPSTIVRILSVWKHYNEYGNTLAFKPRFIVEDRKLRLIPNLINSREKFTFYRSYLHVINKFDYFYQTKFLKEILQFPYLYSFFTNFKRHISLLNLIIREWKTSKSENPFPRSLAKIMEINLTLRKRLFQDKSVIELMDYLLDDFISYAKQHNFTPILLWMPQKDDILAVHAGEYFYENLIGQLAKKCHVIDLTAVLLNCTENNTLDTFYSDDSVYGGHLSKEGNALIAKVIYDYMQEHNLDPIMSDKKYA
jgi:uncharacterized protein YutD